MFPWQSGSTGEEETQVMHLNPLSGKWGPDLSCIQRHVSFAIAYNTWKYWERTADEDFLVKYGAEMMLSIAKYGASITKLSSKDGRYHTSGLMGPDEFHEKMSRSAKGGYKDNAYTNFLIVWTLQKAKETLTVIDESDRKRLLNKLKITSKDLAKWTDITHRMNIIIDKDGIISQFDGYFNLKELDWDGYRAKYDNIKRLDRILKAEGKSPNEYKVAKQADVLMIFYMFHISEVKTIFEQLGYKVDKHMVKKNYEYYVKRTSHGSTLSRVVHCYVAHLLGRYKEAWNWFTDVLQSDIYDTQGGTTPEGIHAGVMGGSIDIVMRSFAGVTILDDVILLSPSLPKQWKSLNTSFLYRGSRVDLIVTNKSLKIFIESEKPVKVPFKIFGDKYKFKSGSKHTVPLSK
jgi:trehalose/maltose hydrolase-like predicted phosphorylase